MRVLSALLLAAALGCGGSRGGEARPDAAAAAIAVDVQTAREGRLVPAVEVSGTTRPMQEVVVRARTEGRLLALEVDIGDAVTEGQVVGRLEDDLPRQAVREAESQLAAARAEAASTSAAAGAARLGLEQAQIEADRYARLSARGIASRQDAEQRSTTARTAAQQTETQAALVSASRARIAAQQALVAQARERLSHVALRSPISGRVLERLSEPGNLLAPGDGLVRIGDLSRIKVVTTISELDLPRVAVDREVPVRFDAHPDAAFVGRVARISPQADPVSRLVPVEILVDNPDGRVGAGLLARVRLEADEPARVLVPAAALETGGRTGGRGGSGGGAERASATGGAGGSRRATLFLVEDGPNGPTAAARAVVVGRRADGLAEILEGLEPGVRVVARAARPLRDGARLQASALSRGGAGAGGGGAGSGRADGGSGDAASGGNGGAAEGRAP